jgi:hypothetical protein
MNVLVDYLEIDGERKAFDPRTAISMGYQKPLG